MRWGAQTVHNVYVRLLCTGCRLFCMLPFIEGIWSGCRKGGGGRIATARCLP